MSTTHTTTSAVSAINAATSIPPAAANALPEHERQRCEVWTRVMGYHRPTSEFNPGKQSEHRERRHFIEAGNTPCQHG